MAKRKRNPKNPYTLLFWNDLENDERLGTCSLAAKGLWTCHLLPIAARSVAIVTRRPPCSRPLPSRRPRASSG